MNSGTVSWLLVRLMYIIRTYPPGVESLQCTLAPRRRRRRLPAEANRARTCERQTEGGLSQEGDLARSVTCDGLCDALREQKKVS
jgi:hypothetical protein